MIAVASRAQAVVSPDLARRSMAMVKRYSRLRPARALLAIAVDWAVVAVCFGTAVQWPDPLLWLAAATIIAGRQHALLILMHDGAHFRLHPNRRVNDGISDLFLALPFFVTTSGYRSNHLSHHSFLNTERDPDWMRKLGNEDWTLPKTRRKAALLILRDILGGGWFDQLRTIVNLRGRRNKAARRFSFRTLIYLAGGAGIAAMITALGLWTAMIALWWLPMFTALPALFRIRSIAEHFGLEGENEMNSSRNYRSPIWERVLFSPHNVGYHLDHHLFPSVPFYNLPRLHQFLDSHPDYRRAAHQSDALFGSTPASVASEVILTGHPAIDGPKIDTALNRKRRQMNRRAHVRD